LTGFGFNTHLNSRFDGVNAKMPRSVEVFFFISVLILGVQSESLPVRDCQGDESVNCEVNDIRITPCKGFAKSGFCRFKLNTVAHLEVDFTPKFESPTVHSQMYWNGFIELPLVGMDTDGCKTTNCPTKSGEKQTYTYDLMIQYPSGIYEVKHLITGNNTENQKCCFLFKIKF